MKAGRIGTDCPSSMSFTCQDHFSFRQRPDCIAHPIHGTESPVAARLIPSVPCKGAEERPGYLTDLNDE
jgi:hypothetical protein